MMPWMRCRHCSTRFSKDLTIAPFRASCPNCARIAAPIFVSSQGDGITGFREIMIRQNAGDPSRKLLETRSCQFVIFLDESGGIVGFDLEDRDAAQKDLSMLAGLDFGYRDVAERLDKLAASKDNGAGG